MDKRKIKFRAWHRGEGLMIDWDFIVDDGILAYFASDDYHLMQYTGLKDKNGREIYEGDVVVFPFMLGKGGRPVVIEWLDGGWNWLNIYYTGGLDIEVIGNVYENPELLDGK